MRLVPKKSARTPMMQGAERRIDVPDQREAQYHVF